MEIVGRAELCQLCFTLYQKECSLIRVQRRLGIAAGALQREGLPVKSGIRHAARTSEIQDVKFGGKGMARPGEVVGLYKGLDQGNQDRDIACNGSSNNANTESMPNTLSAIPHKTVDRVNTSLAETMETKKKVEGKGSESRMTGASTVVQAQGVKAVEIQTTRMFQDKVEVERWGR
ncbi:unnamed protein product, partial [Choristocarpus tenellus]